MWRVCINICGHRRYIWQLSGQMCFHGYLGQHQFSRVTIVSHVKYLCCILSTRAERVTIEQLRKTQKCFIQPFVLLHKLSSRQFQIIQNIWSRKLYMLQITKIIRQLISILGNSQSVSWLIVNQYPGQITFAFIFFVLSVISSTCCICSTASGLLKRHRITIIFTYFYF